MSKGAQHYTAETAKVEILRLTKQIEGMTKKGEPLKGSFNAKLLATCRSKKARLEGLLLREDRPAEFHSAQFPGPAPSASLTKEWPRHFVFHERTTPPDMKEWAKLGIPKFLKRDANNRAPFMK